MATPRRSARISRHTATASAQLPAVCLEQTIESAHKAGGAADHPICTDQESHVPPAQTVAIRQAPVQTDRQERLSPMRTDRQERLVPCDQEVSKTSMSENPTTGFNFVYRADDNLSAEAQRIMDSVRKEAARSRPPTAPKSNSRRFSELHRKQFSKMASIKSPRNPMGVSRVKGYDSPIRPDNQRPNEKRFCPVLPSVVTTPTQASLARARSTVKTPLTIQSPCRERKKRCIGGSMKSILQRPMFKFSNDPTKIAAGTHLPIPEEAPPIPSPPTLKRVEFEAGTKHGESLRPNPAKDEVMYPSLDALISPKRTDFTFRADSTLSFAETKNSPTIRRVRQSAFMKVPGSFEDHDDFFLRHDHDDKSDHVDRKRKYDENCDPHERASKRRMAAPPNTSPRKGISMSRLNMLAQPKWR